MKICAADCDRPATDRDWCHAHYERIRRGDPVGGPILDTPEKRFFAKVKRAEGRYADRCWLWTGATDGGSRYGAFQYEGRVQRAHRVAYMMLVGPIPEGHELDHLCRVTLCVNPSHLEPVDHRTNVLRGESFQAKNARKTHCIRGHEFTPENTIRMNRGGRKCRECARTRYERTPRRDYKRQASAA